MPFLMKAMAAGVPKVTHSASQQQLFRFPLELWSKLLLQSLAAPE